MPSYRPTLADSIVIVVTGDHRMLFICWVERVGSEERWIFVSGDRVRYTGPAYAGQRSLEAIRQLVEAWWQEQRRGERPAHPVRRWINSFIRPSSGWRS